MEWCTQPRHPLYINAILATAELGSRTCKLRDFCLGEMFLGPLGHETDLRFFDGGTVCPGDPVTIDFSVALRHSSEHFRLHARVARLFEGSIGVAFCNPDPVTEYVMEQFTMSKAPPGKVCFEVTETAAVANLAAASSFIQTVKKFDYRFSLNDFGSGRTAYSYLKNLPFDYLKIDDLFVKDMVNSSSDLAVVRSINEIGHFMGKKMVAEYYEPGNDSNVPLFRED